MYTPIERERDRYIDLSLSLYIYIYIIYLCLYRTLNQVSMMLNVLPMAGIPLAALGGVVGAKCYTPVIQVIINSNSNNDSSNSTSSNNNDK